MILFGRLRGTTGVLASAAEMTMEGFGGALGVQEQSFHVGFASGPTQLLAHRAFVIGQKGPEVKRSAYNLKVVCKTLINSGFGLIGTFRGKKAKSQRDIAGSIWRTRDCLLELGYSLIEAP